MEVFRRVRMRDKVENVDCSLTDIKLGLYLINPKFTISSLGAIDGFLKPSLTNFQAGCLCHVPPP